MKTVHVRIEGRVQGVFFRDYTQREARRLSLAGWVMNNPDGAVEAVFQGTDEQLEIMKEWLHTGSPHAIVTSVTSQIVDDAEILAEFQVRYR